MGDVPNPAAFPSQEYGPDGLPAEEMTRGMDLRDWFAGQALAGFLADGSQRAVNEACKEQPDFLDMGPTARAHVVNRQVAWGCYALADAMLVQRGVIQKATGDRS